MKIEEIRNEILDMINKNYENEIELLNSLNEYADNKIAELNKPKPRQRWKRIRDKKKERKANK